MEKVFEIYIKATPERIWEALTDGDLRGQYSFSVDASAETVEAEAPRRLVQTMVAEWSDEVRREGPSRITYEIEPRGDMSRLTVTHDQLREGANDQLYGGWPMILSGLKTLLESGEMLTTPGSLRWLEGNKQHLPEVH